MENNHVQAEDLQIKYFTLSADHSYCAIGSSVEQVADLFAVPSGSSTQTFSNDDNMSVSNGLSLELGDVTFDGFKYSIQSIPAPTNAIELGSIWNDVANAELGVSGAKGESDKPNVEEVARDEVTKSTTSKVLKPRRRNYIENDCKRKEYFNQKFQSLTSHLHRVMSRTGCEGELSAYFEGKTYNTAWSTRNSFLCSTMQNCNERISPEIHLSQCHAEIDDHRYAATMPAEKNSSAMDDHSYNGSGVQLRDGSDLEIEEMDFGDRLRKRKRVERFDYIKVRWARDQTFSKFSKSLFTQKSTLEDRTGAVVMLTLKYERCTFDENNYQLAYNTILSSRKPKPGEMPKIAPKQQPSSTPLTFIMSNFNPLSLPTPCFVPSSSTFAENPLIATKNVQGVIPLSDVSVLQNNEMESRHLAVGSVVAECTMNDAIVEPLYDDMICSPVPGYIDSSSQIPEQCSNLSEICELQMFNNSKHNQRRSESKRIVTNSATNTEPVCSSCQNSQEVSNPYWIRCNDPFCHDMMHASCVGFMITCKSHLKQLPAYYCKVHR